MTNAPPPQPDGDDRTASLGSGASPPSGGPRRGDLIVGRYRMLRRIGVGGMGEVFEANDERLHRAIALKIMGPVGDDADAALSEARKAARLRHPCVAGVQDAGTFTHGDSSWAFIAMEIVPGGERLDAWARRAQADLPRRLEVLVQVCRAIAHAHERGVVHSDLKPSNILVDADGTPRVIDFGVARFLGLDESLQPARGGTPGYAPPEQQHAIAPPLDGRADVYALGIVATELTRDLPCPPSMRADLDLVLDAATHAERSARIATPDALADNLDAVRRGRTPPIASGRPSPRRAAAAAARRNPLAWMVASAGAGFAVAVLVIIPLVHAWTPIHNWFEAALSALPRVGPAVPPLDAVRVVLLTDADDIDALGASENLGEVRAADVVSWRTLHGRAMERLAAAAPRAVVWDVRFRDPSLLEPAAREAALEADAALVRGMRSLEAAGAGVAVASTTWDVESDGLPIVSRAVLAVAGWGVATGVHNDREPWRVDIARVPASGSGATRSLSIQALAAAECPDCEVDLALDTDTGEATLRFWRPVPGIATGRTLVGNERSVRASSIQPIAADNATLGLRAGDAMGVLEVDVPADAVLAAATLSYSDLFTLDAHQLRERVGGRTVVMGSVRSGQDLHAHPSGRRLPGPWAHACAIDAMSRGASVRRLPPGGDMALIALAAAAGGGAGALGFGQGRARSAFLACLVAVCAGLTIALYALGSIVLNTLVQGVGALIAWELAAWGARLRRS